VCTIPLQGRCKFSTQGVPPQKDIGRRVGFGCGEFAGRSFTRGQYEYGGMIAAFGLGGATCHDIHLVVCVVLQGDVWVFHLGVIGWILLTPLLSKWNDTGLIHFTLTLVLSHLLTLTLILVLYFTGGRPRELLVDRLRLLSTRAEIEGGFPASPQWYPRSISFLGTMGKVECFQWA
jgi:hypothetical protein